MYSMGQVVTTRGFFCQSQTELRKLREYVVYTQLLYELIFYYRLYSLTKYEEL